MPKQKPAKIKYPAEAPTSIQGVEARDFPDQGRGSVDTNPGKVAARRLPRRTGGTIGGDVGVRGMPSSAESDNKGGRKKN